MSQRIYLAGPFFSEDQTKRLHLVRDLLAENPSVGFIYEPAVNQQQEIVEKYGSIEKAMHEQEWQTATYRADTQAIRQADAIVAVLDFDYESGNLLPDPGTVYEIGYAQALGKPIILVQSTDVGDDPLNLMLTQYTAYFDKDDILGKTAHRIDKYDFLRLPQVNNETRIVF